MEKLTKLQMFERVLSRLVEPAERAFVEHEMELLQRKRGSRAMTAKQKEAVAMREALFEAMEPGVQYSMAQLMELVESTQGVKVSSQKVATLVKPLVETGVVVKTLEKRKACYQLVEVEVE